MRPITQGKGRLAVIALLLALGAAAAGGVPPRAEGTGDATVGRRQPRREKKQRKPSRRARQRTPLPSSSGVARGDFNGDGIGDLAVSAPREDVGAVFNAGVVHVIYGTSNGLSSAGNQIWHQDSAGVPGAGEEGDRFGDSLAAGDFNGDGFSDLAIGAPFEDEGELANSGTVTILVGTSGGLTAAGSQLWTATGAGGASRARGLFGWSLAWGDFNGDGEGDLAIGEPGHPGPDAVNDAGAVFLLYGIPFTGLTRQGAQLVNEDCFAELAEPSRREEGDQLGYTLAAGDFNGDRVSDLCIGLPREDLGTQNSAVDAGSAYVVSGAAGIGLRCNPSAARLQQGIGDRYLNEADDRFAGALAVGDFNQDGFQDLVVGIPGEDLRGGSDAGGLLEGTFLRDAGMVMVYPGSAGGISATLRQPLGEDSPNVAGVAASPDVFGGSLAAGDFNADGATDLAVGASFTQVDGKRSAGAVTVLYGSSTGLRGTGSQAWTQAQGWGGVTAEEFDRFGYSLTAWNFGRGSAADLVIGVPFEDIGATPDAGIVQVLYGSASGLTTSGNQVWSQSNLQGGVEAGDNFGTAAY